MIPALLAWTLLITPAMDAIDLSVIASKMARQNLISRGHCVRLQFSTADDLLLCRTDRGHPYVCRDVVLSGWMDYRVLCCETFNER